MGKPIGNYIALEIPKIRDQVRNLKRKLLRLWQLNYESSKRWDK